MMHKAWLADPSAILPIFGKPGMIFPADGMEINPDGEEWRVLLADGTLTLTAPSAAPAPAPEPAPAPAPGKGRNASKE